MIPACSKKMEKDLFIRLGCFLDFASKTAQNHPKPRHLQFQETKGVMKGDFPLQIPKLRNRTIGKLSLLSIHLRFCNTKGVLTLALPFSIRPLVFKNQCHAAYSFRIFEDFASSHGLVDLRMFLVHLRINVIFV
jgi:hypothetical protein